MREPERLFPLAERALLGVGDRTLGEWREIGTIAVHLRRRLSTTEEAIVGPVVDVRGTWEHTKRLNRVRRFLPCALRLLPDADLL